MIDSIFIAMTGLHGYEKGLRVISNDTANLNTPGFKSSSLQFSDLFYTTELLGDPGGSSGQYGYGVDTVGTVLNLNSGDLQKTGNGMDLAVDGVGMFVLKDDAGNVHYTRNGQFEFGEDGILVASGTGERVMALDEKGGLNAISIAELQTGAASPTANVKLRGNLSSTDTNHEIDGLIVIDKEGTAHTLKLKFDRVTDVPGAWDVSVLDEAVTVSSLRLAFADGKPDPATSKLEFSYGTESTSAITVTLDFSADVTSADGGATSSLAIASRDGYGSGKLLTTVFDETGTLELGYSNGQTVPTVRLALARFLSQDGVVSTGESRFEAKDGSTWITGHAGEEGFGEVSSGTLEKSNVDLSQEFTELVIMQRGYQACSQVISTASDMMSTLFAMWKR